MNIKNTLDKFKEFELEIIDSDGHTIKCYHPSIISRIQEEIETALNEIVPQERFLGVGSDEYVMLMEKTVDVESYLQGKKEMREEIKNNIKNYLKK